MSTLSLINPFNRALAFLLRLVPYGARLLLLALAGVLTALIVTLFKGSLDTVEESVGALGWTLNPETALEQRITIVAIDEKSLAQEGNWPWPRATMARLVTALNDAGVQLQLHDIVFPETAQGDDALALALQASRGAVLAQQPQLNSEQTLRTGVLSHPVSGVSCSDGLASTSNYIANNATFASIPKGTSPLSFLRMVLSAKCRLSSV